MIVFDQHRAAGLDREAAGARDRGFELLKESNQFLGEIVARVGRFANRDPLLFAVVRRAGAEDWLARPRARRGSAED